LKTDLKQRALQFHQENNTIVIEVQEVHKSFKNVHAVQGINLKIREGEFVALLGPNGAGKTTLVEMIEGIQKPDKGQIRIMGKHWEGHADELHNLIGLSLQETRFIDKLRVWETLILFASFYSLGKNRVYQIIELIGLEEKRRAYVVNLSGGQRQRLALGIALLNRPKILLLDEPTTGLDPNARREIWAILLRLKEEAHTSLILTTHYMEEAERLCDYIVIMDKGKILREGFKDSLLIDHEEEKIVEFSVEEPSGLDAGIFRDAPYTISWDEKQNSGKVKIPRVEKNLPSFLNYLSSKDLLIKNLEWRRQTLDDLFTSLTGRHLDE
jgi:ABC-2 type transport system ATP-binding protein